LSAAIVVGIWIFRFENVAPHQCGSFQHPVARLTTSRC
jgi:hypothetical protein